MSLFGVDDYQLIRCTRYLGDQIEESANSTRKALQRQEIQMGNIAENLGKLPQRLGPTKTVYRVENTDKKQGLWRDFDGTWNPKFHLLTDGKCRNAPMDRSSVYGEGGKRWFASAPTKETLRVWFSLSDLQDLLKNGFKIYEFTVSQWKVVSDCEFIFPRDAIVDQVEIPVSEIYREASHAEDSDSVAIVPARIALNLCRAIGERDRKKQEEFVRELAKYLDDTGHGDLAGYALAQIGATPVWVPM